MASLSNGLRHARCQAAQLSRQTFHQTLAIRPRHQPITPLSSVRCLNTSETPSASQSPSPSELQLINSKDTSQTPFYNHQHVRHVPVGSYFSREPTFNAMHLRLFDMLTKHSRLPMVKPSDAPKLPWLKLETVRQQTGEPIKAAHFSRVMRVAKRLNLIEPTVRPKEVDVALAFLSKPIDSSVNIRAPTTVDKHGRAVGVGRRKESTARAFVVEGTGEVLVNGKTLDDAFGRVHDRESALWALTSTNRMDKYNVWVIVRGGGVTGQAEAITMAIANGLVAHEPALKTALRQAGCITRDPRMVERKKHGRVKARKAPAWVKR